MSTNCLVVASESKLRDSFLDILDPHEMDLLVEYAGLCTSTEKLESQLKTSFGDKSSWVLSRILSLH